LTVGWKSIFHAIKEAKKLKQAFIYIISYFLFSDATVTMNSLIGVIQNDITGFNGFKITLVNFVSAITSIIGCVSVLSIQKYFDLRTKTMLMAILLATLILPLWGSFGLNQEWNFGIRTETELWIFYVWFGIGTAPIYAYQQTMLAELIPPGKEGLFFGLFGIVSRASAWIGPLVVGLFTNTTNYGVWSGWPFCALLFFVPLVMIFFIDEDRARADIEEYMRAEQAQEKTSDFSQSSDARTYEEVKH
jgi:MFS-type transporter involved in bile tolerance (Atg22 family)